MDENTNVAESVANIVKDAFKPAVIGIGKVADDEPVEVLAYPEGMSIVDVENFFGSKRKNPRRREGVAKHTTLDSFIAHANRFKDPDSALFAIDDMKTPSLSAVYDYHEALTLIDADGEIAKDRGLGAAAPRFGKHRAVYSFPLSVEWKAWLEGNGQSMSQQEFAEFIENRIMDILPTPDPESGDESATKLLDFAKQISGSFASPAKMMELSRGLAVRVDERVKTAVNLASGEGEIQYEQTHASADGQALRVPSLFLIGIPIFERGERYRLCVRLRYRAIGGSVRWFYEIFQADRAFADAFSEACGRAAEETKLPLFFGAPEA